MVFNQVDPLSILDRDESTIYTVATPPETVPSAPATSWDGHNPEPSSFLVPWPGSTFIIRSVSSGHVLTLLDGQIVLTQPGGRGSIHWACVETKGWLGFLNVVSGKFLGYDANWKLCCSAERHSWWEFFCIRMRPEGGCVLLMTHYERLWQVGIKVEQGVEKLAKMEYGGSDRIVWEFAKI
ncbi:MAG: hypothetical protein Q9205_008073 [Flavoplaca limonia]